MQKLVFLMVGFGILVGILAPSNEPVPPAAPAEAGLFEAAPYKETQLTRKANGHFYVTAYVQGAPVTFVVDTGATMVALTEADARAAGLKFSQDEFVPVARTANGIANGKLVTLSKVAIEGKEVTGVEAAIVQNAEVSLLGQAYLARISGVQMAGEHMILR